MTPTADVNTTATAIVALLVAKELLDIFRGKRVDARRHGQITEISSILTSLKLNVDGLRNEVTNCLHLIQGADSRSGIIRDQERLEGRIEDIERRERARLEAEAAGLHIHRRHDDAREA